MAHLIDWHAHFLPEGFADTLRRREVPPRITRDTNGRELRVTEPGSAGQALRPAFVSLDHRLAANDRAGVERQILSLPGFATSHLNPDEALVLARTYNESLSAVVTGFPDRFSGLATLPSDHVDLATAELERAVTELGLIGAVLPVDAFLTLASARELQPILAVADELGAHLFIHPGGWRGSRGFGPSGTDDGVPFRGNVIDLQGRIASAFATVAYSDLFTPFERVTVQLANLGGAIPFYVDRLNNVAHERGLGDPISPLRRFYVDTGSQGTRSVQLAASVLGADRILFGTDDPVFSLPENARAISESDLSPEAQEQILTLNGRALLARHPDRVRL